MSKSVKHLMDAFAGESQANRKYLAYAKQADKEGFNQVAKLFRAVAEAETVHAHTHLRTAGKIHETMANLKDAIEGETEEFTNMYPQMIADAEQEGNKTAQRSFEYANAVEKIHAGLYKRALEAQGKITDVDYYICSVCGYTHEGPHADKCPICKADPKAFFVSN